MAASGGDREFRQRCSTFIMKKWVLDLSYVMLFTGAMEATREVVRVTGKPLRWTLWGVKIASWLLWGTGLLLVGVAACLIVVAINIRGMWFIIVAVMGKPRKICLS